MCPNDILTHVQQFDQRFRRGAVEQLRDFLSPSYIDVPVSASLFRARGRDEDGDRKLPVTQDHDLENLK